MSKIVGAHGVVEVETIVAGGALGEVIGSLTKDVALLAAMIECMRLMQMGQCPKCYEDFDAKHERGLHGEHVCPVCLFSVPPAMASSIAIPHLPSSTVQCARIVNNWCNREGK